MNNFFRQFWNLLEDISAGTLKTYENGNKKSSVKYDSDSEGFVCVKLVDGTMAEEYKTEFLDDAFMWAKQAVK